MATGDPVRTTLDSRRGGNPHEAGQPECPAAGGPPLARHAAAGRSSRVPRAASNHGSRGNGKQRLG